MKIAVWRYGMSMQSNLQSTVGGGLLNDAVIRALVLDGHEVTVVGPVAKGVNVALLGAKHQPTMSLAGFQGVVMMTGPYNPLYGDAAFDTYRRLATFQGKVAYAQWDVALPFHFHAMENTKVAGIAKIDPKAVAAGKEWFVLAQTSDADLRSKSGKTVAYDKVKFTHVPCLFELEELKRPALPSTDAPTHSIGYFGSDRPGRVAEVERWFTTETAPSTHLWGRWSPKSLQRLANAQGMSTSCEYRGMVKEGDVANVLNSYASTMYLADPAYVKTDFIAQRFFENVTAGVPVLYSDKIQPSVRTVIPASSVCSSAGELATRFEEICGMSARARRKHVLEHDEAVRAFADTRTDTLSNAMRKVFR